MTYLTQGTGIIPISLPMESSKFIFWGLNPLIVFYFESCTLDDLVWKISHEIQKEKAHQYLLKCTSTRGIESTEVTEVRKYIHTQNLYHVASFIWCTGAGKTTPCCWTQHCIGSDWEGAFWVLVFFCFRIWELICKSVFSLWKFKTPHFWGLHLCLGCYPSITHFRSNCVHLP